MPCQDSSPLWIWNLANKRHQQTKLSSPVINKSALRKILRIWFFQTEELWTQTYHLPPHFQVKRKWTWIGHTLWGKTATARQAEVESSGKAEGHATHGAEVWRLRWGRDATVGTIWNNMRRRIVRLYLFYAQNSNRTKWSPIQSVIIRVLNKFKPHKEVNWQR